MDNYDKWEQHDAEQQRQLARLPECSECGEHIQSDKCYEINDELICPKCMEENHGKWVDDCCDG